MLPPGTMSSPLILFHKVLSNRRILLLLSQLALFGFVCWVILGAGSPTSSTNSLPLTPLPLNGAYTDSFASTAVFKGTFDRTSCPAMGCDYTPLVAAFETIHNGTAGAKGALIDQDRSKYEANAIIFNPSFMRMPAGSHWELMVVVRGPSITAMSGGYMQHRTYVLPSPSPRFPQLPNTSILTLSVVLERTMEPSASLHTLPTSKTASTSSRRPTRGCLI